MSFLFLILGQVNVALFEHQEAPPTLPDYGFLGAMDDFLETGGSFAAIGAGLGLTSPVSGPEAELTIDVSLQETHSLSGEVTRYPVEDGSQISDHINLLPRRLTLQGLMTDTPNDVSLVGRFASMPRSVLAFQTLKRLRDTKTLLDVITSLEVYQSMVIADLEVPRDGEKGKSLHFSLRLEELKIVNSSIGPANTGMLGAESDAQVGSVVLR